MVHFQRCTVRTLFSRVFPLFVKTGISLGGLAVILSAAPCAGQCCGQPVIAPVVSQSYRLDYQTVYEEQKMTAYRMT